MDEVKVRVSIQPQYISYSKVFKKENSGKRGENDLCRYPHTGEKRRKLYILLLDWLTVVGYSAIYSCR